MDTADEDIAKHLFGGDGGHDERSLGYFGIFSFSTRPLIKGIDHLLSPWMIYAQIVESQSQMLNIPFEVHISRCYIGLQFTSQVNSMMTIEEEGEQPPSRVNNRSLKASFYHKISIGLKSFTYNDDLSNFSTNFFSFTERAYLLFVYLVRCYPLKC